MIATLEPQTSELAESGEKVVNLEVAPQATTVSCRLVRGIADDRGFEFGPAIHEAAREAVDKAVAKYRAEIGSLLAGSEVERLERLTVELKNKITELAEDADALRNQIAELASEGSLAKPERTKLASLAADQESHAGVLEAVEKRLAGARKQLEVERPAVAARHRAMANEAAEAAMVKAREAIEGLGELWRILDELAVTVCANQQIAEAIG